MREAPEPITIAGQTYGFGYSYNLAGSLVSETYPSGRTISTGYDAANRVTQMGGVLNGQPTSYVASVSYQPHGGPFKMEYGNGLWRTYTYNQRLQVSGLWDALGDDGNRFLFLENPIDWGTTKNNGTVQDLTVYAGGPGPSSALAVFPQSFQYDNLNRLIGAADGGGWSRGYNYDQFGNRWVNGGIGNALAVSGVSPQNNVYDAATNRIAAGRMANANLSYDAAGNLTSYTTDTMTYDAENRQVGMQDSSTSGTAVYQYDGSGQRVLQNNTVYVYDARWGTGRRSIRRRRCPALFAERVT